VTESLRGWRRTDSCGALWSEHGGGLALPASPRASFRGVVRNLPCEAERPADRRPRGGRSLRGPFAQPRTFFTTSCAASRISTPICSTVKIRRPSDFRTKSAMRALPVQIMPTAFSNVPTYRDFCYSSSENGSRQAPPVSGMVREPGRGRPKPNHGGHAHEPEALDHVTSRGVHRRVRRACRCAAAYDPGPTTSSRYGRAGDGREHDQPGHSGRAANQDLQSARSRAADGHESDSPGRCGRATPRTVNKLWAAVASTSSPRVARQAQRAKHASVERLLGARGVCLA